MVTSGYSFEDLEVYKIAREYRKRIYGLTRRLPAEEKFGLRSQMCRAALSVTNNIGEGHGRFHFLQNILFLRISRGSLEELIDDLNVCIDENYFPTNEIEVLKAESYILLHRLNGYICYLRKRKASHQQKITSHKVS